MRTTLFAAGLALSLPFWTMAARAESPDFSNDASSRTFGSARYERTSRTDLGSSPTDFSNTGSSSVDARYGEVAEQMNTTANMPGASPTDFSEAGSSAGRSPGAPFRSPLRDFAEQ
ncbi:Hypothetical protein HVPorG_00365 [Roseomonas mucosa]|uniref:hypothetical protein n=1 Tax=Roseomonas mucosa TaxID=207340 RepID=UPI0022036915|nr:hypothetical protein [Roseomonas mucosa]QDJ08486.1 Hypothetical protein HVPorG_00365 [Roseomonas mucosa]